MNHVLVITFQEECAMLKRVQKRFTLILFGLKGLSYQKRLDRLVLFSLEQCRLIDDTIEAYKSLA